MEIRSLKDIATAIRTGKTPPTKEEKYFNGKINWYSPGDLDKTKYLLDAKRTITNEAIEDKKAITFPKDTLLIGCIGDIGKLGITSEVSSSNQQITGILPNDQTNVSYLFYWFKGNKKVLENYSNNAVVPILNNRTLETVKIPLPPLDQQKKIAAILDAADAYRQKTKALIEKYDELTQSLFLDMFGDPFTNIKSFPDVKLEEVCDELFLGLTSKVDYVDKGGFPLIRAKDINNGILSFKETKYISEVQHKKLTSRRITKRGDVLISKSGTLGTCAISNTDREFSTYESIFTVRPKRNKLISVFLVYLVRSRGFQLKLLDKQVGGTVAHLNLKMFRDFDFPLPPLELQNQFAERVQSIEEQKAQAEASLAQSEDLFNSLLQRAFKGELTS